MILVARLNFSREVATLIVVFAVPAGEYNTGQACDPIVVDDVEAVSATSSELETMVTLGQTIEDQLLKISVTTFGQTLINII